MATSTSNIVINGKDNTAAAFKSIHARAISAGNRIASVMGGAIAAAGAYLSVRSVKETIDELSHLSDVAQKANVASGELQQLSTALSILGIQGSDIDTLGKSFAYMSKNTGRTGMQGFYDTIAEIARIPDVAGRSEAAIKAFGKSGLELMPIINAAKESTAALQGVVSAMAAMQEKTANVADDIADGWTIAANSIKAAWQDAIGWIAEAISGETMTSFRQSMVVIMAYVDDWIRGIADTIRGAIEMWQSAYRIVGGSIGGGIGALIGGGGIKDAYTAFKDGAMSEIRDEAEKIYDYNERRAARLKKLEETLEKARHFELNYQNAATGKAPTEPPTDTKPKEKEAPTPKIKEAGEAIANAVESRAVQITNDLIESNSNAAQKLSILGPGYENEQKKQTRVLEQIQKNTAKTAEEIDGTTTYDVTDVGA